MHYNDNYNFITKMILFNFLIAIACSLECYYNGKTIQRNRIKNKCFNASRDGFYTSSELRQVESVDVKTTFRTFKLSSRFRNLREFSLTGSEANMVSLQIGKGTGKLDYYT